MSESLTVATLIARIRETLADAGQVDAQRDARLIVAHSLGLNILDLITKPDLSVPANAIPTIDAMVVRRVSGESVHRILGHRDFFDLDLLLSKETLEPRPDTEILVEAVLPYVHDRAKLNAVEILDLGTGTGAICLSLLAAEKKARGIGVDISADALNTATANAARNGLAERFRPLHSDWFDKVEGVFDIIISNPPYIRSDVIESLDVIVKAFDPPAALDGGPDGLAPYRIIAQEGASYLKDNGIIAVEIGYDQRVAVTAIFEEQNFKLLESRKDYGENDRALIFSR